jgi:tRNA(fMet)-specific endonuclease VapC
MLRHNRFLGSHPVEIVDESAASRFDDLRSQRLRLGAKDLKIAATAFVDNALLLSANRRDFERVPGLRVENWLDGLKREPVAPIASFATT